MTTYQSFWGGAEDVRQNRASFFDVQSKEYYAEYELGFPDATSLPVKATVRCFYPPAARCPRLLANQQENSLWSYVGLVMMISKNFLTIASSKIPKKLFRYLPIICFGVGVGCWLGVGYLPIRL